MKTTLKSELSPIHLYNIHPDWFVTYGDQLYFDPALPESRRHICMVISDIVSRYDVDAIHMDNESLPVGTLICNAQQKSLSAFTAVYRRASSPS